MTQLSGNATTQWKSFRINPSFLRFTACFLCIGFAVQRLSSYNSIGTGKHLRLSTATSTVTSTETNSQEDTSIVNAPPVTIFYNAYVPPNNPEGIARAYGIIEEQMAQIGVDSALAGRNDISLHYASIGEPFDTKFMDDLCTKYQLKCTHVSHHLKGYEMITEQALLDYCMEDENSSHTVAYIHNKGAFHAYEAQNGIRRMLTKSALSEECIGHLTSQQCNVCGANFKSVWGPTFWGNMWSAKCNYVKKLTSPFDLEAKNRLAVQTKPMTMTMSLYDNENVEGYSLGEGRFAAEQFVSTHPSLIPCSFTKPEDAADAFWSEDPPGPFELHVIRSENPNFALMKVNNNHLKEWYLLPGILWQYHVLYNELPSSDSWIWRHYPDGDNWKKAIEEKGFPEALHHRIATETS